jgi:hypothetical protein
VFFAWVSRFLHAEHFRRRDRFNFVILPQKGGNVQPAAGIRLSRKRILSSQDVIRGIWPGDLGTSDQVILLIDRFSFTMARMPSE